MRRLLALLLVFALLAGCGSDAQRESTLSDASSETLDLSSSDTVLASSSSSPSSSSSRLPAASDSSSVEEEPSSTSEPEEEEDTAPAYSYIAASDPFAGSAPLTLSTDSRDPLTIAGELFVAYIQRYLDLAGNPFQQLEDYRVTDSYLLAGDAADFCAYISYDLKPAHPTYHALAEWVDPETGWVPCCYLEMRIRETQPGLFTLITTNLSETRTGLRGLTDYDYDPRYNYAKNPPELYEPCRIESDSQNRVEIGQRMLDRYLAGYLDTSLPDPWRLTHYTIQEGRWLGGSLSSFCVEILYDWTPYLHPLATRIPSYGGEADGAGGYLGCHIQLRIARQADGSYLLVGLGAEGYDTGLSPRPQNEAEALAG